MPNRSPLIRVTTMPTHLSPYGGVFGGWLMSLMAREFRQEKMS